MVRKAGGTIEIAPAVKRIRTTQPKVQGKLNLKPVVEEEINEDQMSLTQIMKQTLKKPKRRLLKMATQKGRNVEIPRLMIEDQTLDIAHSILIRRTKGADSTLEDILEEASNSYQKAH